MGTKRKRSLAILAGVMCLGISFTAAAERGEPQARAKGDWMATERQKACTKKCQKERDNLAYESCLIECNKRTAAPKPPVAEN